MLKSIKKFVSKKRKGIKYVKNTFGIDSILNKETPVYTSTFNTNVFSEMREGFYTSMPRNLSRELKSNVSFS